jgi:hypothetical protein
MAAFGAEFRVVGVAHGDTLPVLRDHTHYPVRLHGIGARAGLRKVGKDTTWLDGYVRHSNRHTFASRTLTSHLTTCTVAVERLVKPGPADPVCEHVSAGELARPMLGTHRPDRIGSGRLA